MFGFLVVSNEAICHLYIIFDKYCYRKIVEVKRFRLFGLKKSPFERLMFSISSSSQLACIKCWAVPRRHSNDVDNDGRAIMEWNEENKKRRRRKQNQTKMNIIHIQWPFVAVALIIHRHIQWLLLLLFYFFVWCFVFGHEITKPFCWFENIQIDFSQLISLIRIPFTCVPLSFWR